MEKTRGNGLHWERFHLNLRNPLQGEQSLAGTSPGTWRSRHCWRGSRCDWTGCKVTSSRLPSPRQARPDDLQGSLPTRDVLWTRGRQQAAPWQSGELRVQCTSQLSPTWWSQPLLHLSAPQLSTPPTPPNAPPVPPLPSGSPATRSSCTTSGPPQCPADPPLMCGGRCSMFAAPPAPLPP